MHWITERQWKEFEEEGTDVHRLATGERGWLDRYGEHVLWSLGGRDRLPPTPPPEMITQLAERFGFVAQGWLVRKLARDASEQSPASILGGQDPGGFSVREGAVHYRVEPSGGYSSGIFMDQRLNRKWVKGLAAPRMLNLFAYTCSFSVCVALAGGRTLSVDASKRSLARGKENFSCNGLSIEEGHRFLADDVMKVVPRLSKRGERFDLIVLDPPTFGRAAGRVFQVRRDLPGLVRDTFALLSPGGWLLVSSNLGEWSFSSLRRICHDALEGGDFFLSTGECPPEISGGAISCRIRRTT